MFDSGSRRKRGESGFTLIELMVVVVIIGLASALALPMYADAITKTKKTALASEGRRIYDSLMAYYADYNAFPPESAFDLETLDPLFSQGYLHSGPAITSKLVKDRALIYLAPDIGGADQQFILVMRLESDPNIIVAVVHTELVGDDGAWADGVYVTSDGDLREADDVLHPGDSKMRG
jgi:prepilin-type N-terminal cleavage/methylation domain-containing protein